jgi:outer membrane receptor for ferrienterochelin and colicin
MFLKSLWLLLFLFIGSACFGQSLLSTPYQPSEKKGKLKSFFKDIKQKTGAVISFSEATVNIKKIAVLNGDEKTIGDVLRTILRDQPVKLEESGEKILIVKDEAPSANLAREVTISGFIKDSSSKEILIGASVYIPALGIGTTTNHFGFYSLTIPSGQHNVTISYVGYRPQILKLGGQSLKYDILLVNDTKMEEVRVTEKVAPAIDHTSLKLEDITYYTSLLGNNDVLKALQHLPGVQSTADGSSNIIVRGGDPGQNLNLLDGVALYYTDHFYGVTSIYNTDALKAIDFYSGSFPSRYGGRLSSITDVNTKDGDMEKVRGVVNIGLLNGSLSLETPIIKDKASAIITARRSWMDLIWRPFDNTIGVNFYDVNAKANYIVDRNNRLYLSVYNGRDMFRVTDNSTQMRTLWGNSFAALKWTRVLGSKLFLNTSATYSAFRYELKDVVSNQGQDTIESTELFKGVSTIKEFTFRSQLYYYFNSRHKIELGIRYSDGLFSPGAVSFEGGLSSNLRVGSAAEEFQSNEAVVYAEDEWKILPQLKLRAGVHWANWLSDDFNYSSIQPRLFISYAPKATLTIYGSASRMAQFLHLLSNNTSGFPTDFWLPSTANIKPETSLLGNLGFKADAKALTYGLELYYKHQENLLAYKGGQNIFDNAQYWEDKLTQGKGWSYGAELSARRQAGRYTASLAYTLSWSFRQYEQLNYGRAFPYRYDRRHNLHIDGSFRYSKGITISGGWTYMSGEAITLPDQVYPDFDNNLLNNPVNYNYTYNYTGWNNFRLPAIHRLDLAVNFYKKKKRYERTITAGIYNAYGRKNLIGTALVQDEQGAFELQGYSIARFIPTLSYRLQF